jgi:hypothetical protein
MPYRAGATHSIRVAFHVITDGPQGQVSDAQIDEQMRELNRNYAGTGFRFELVSVDRTDNHIWFKLSGYGSERAMKEALAVDPAHTLNVYTAGLKWYLGWAYFPWSLPEDHYLHGVVVHYGSLPDGYIENYNLGRTLSHETGHYLGLYHTFQGGCTAPGDWVDDTPFEASPAYGCPLGRDTCVQPGEDPIHNYMDYSDDVCYSEFTSGQDDRMDAAVATFRPSLLSSPVAMAALENAGPAPELRSFALLGAAPQPVSGWSSVRFHLGAPARVQLELYSVAGQRVRTLAEGVFPAGDHSAPLDATTLRAGVYFALLRVDGAVQSRPVVLTR